MVGGLQGGERVLEIFCHIHLQHRGSRSHLKQSKDEILFIDVSVGMSDGVHGRSTQF